MLGSYHEFYLFECTGTEFNRNKTKVNNLKSNLHNTLDHYKVD